MYIIGYIPFTGRVRYLAVSDKFTVYPYIKAGVNTFKVKISPESVNFINVKCTDICAAWIIVRNVWRIVWERITVVSVLMTIISLSLPYGRYFYISKTAAVEIRKIKWFL